MLSPTPVVQSLTYGGRCPVALRGAYFVTPCCAWFYAGEGQRSMPRGSAQAHPHNTDRNQQALQLARNPILRIISRAHSRKLSLENHRPRVVMSVLRLLAGGSASYENLRSFACPLLAQKKAVPRRTFVGFPSLPQRLVAMSSKTDEQNSQEKTVNVRIKGIVQGVFYRQWTIETAQSLGLNGWVRNRKDGTVEAVFSGKADIVDKMVEYCRGGPPAARVTAIDVKPTGTDVSKGFHRHPTA